MTTTSSLCTQNTNQTLQDTKKDSGGEDAAINVTVISSLLAAQINMATTLSNTLIQPTTPQSSQLTLALGFPLWTYVDSTLFK